MIYFTGPKHRQRFLCELTVTSFAYVGVGNSTTKKVAEKNAVWDFISFLVRTNVINANDVPANPNVADSIGQPVNDARPMLNQQQQPNVFNVIRKFYLLEKRFLNSFLSNY